MKKFIKTIMGVSFSVLKNSLEKNPTLLVFIYHDVSEAPSEFSKAYNLNVFPEIFEYQINFIKKNFRIISPKDLTRGKFPNKAALITFDDGFRSYFVSAIPILEKHRVPSINFLNMETVKGGLFWGGLITYLYKERKSFKNYLKKAAPKALELRPSYLLCNKKLVKDYLAETGDSFEKEVRQFSGEFADESDLRKASINPLVFFGNHLYNHEVPLWLSNEELLRSYLKNEEELKNYPNFMNMSSLPFGQPNTCYSQKQVNLLLEQGAKKVFSSSGCINFDINSTVLDRIPLSSFNNSAPKIWYQIFRKRISF